MEIISGVDHDKLGLRLKIFRMFFVLCVLAGNFSILLYLLEAFFGHSDLFFFNDERH